MIPERSIIDHLLGLSGPDRARAFAGLSAAELTQIESDWRIWARPAQLAPSGDWSIWLILAGRGWGKTRAGAEHVAAFMRLNPNCRVGLIGTSFAEGRDTMMEGVSGLLEVLSPSELAGGTVAKAWNRSLGELRLANGARAKVFSAERPDQLRGPSHHLIWADELAAWQSEEAFDTAMLGLRQGTRPQMVITTTPRPRRLIRELVARAKAGGDVVLSGGSTYENLANLAPSFGASIIARYEGTRLGAQELHAQILDEFPGAYWSRAQIEATRVERAPKLDLIVVGLDPAATSKPGSDLSGIVVGARGQDGDLYVLHGRGYRLSPQGWAEKTVELQRVFGASRIIAEVNQGGEMVTQTIHHVDATARVKMIHASKGKALRAEPIAVLYEQGRVHHVGRFEELEDQMCAFPVGGSGDDVVDALVYALTECRAPAPYEVSIEPPSLRRGSLWGDEPPRRPMFHRPLWD